MDFYFKCPLCSESLGATEKFIGNDLLCTHCKGSITVPYTQMYLDQMNLTAIQCSKCNFFNGYSGSDLGRKISCRKCSSKIKIPTPKTSKVEKPIKEQKPMSKKGKIILSVCMTLIIIIPILFILLKGPQSYSLEEIKDILKENSFYLASPDAKKDLFNRINCQSYMYVSNYKEDNVFIKIFISFEGEFMGLSSSNEYELNEGPSIALYNFERAIEKIMVKKFDFVDRYPVYENLNGPNKIKENYRYDKYHNHYGYYYYLEVKTKEQFKGYNGDKVYNRIGVLIAKEDL